MLARGHTVGSHTWSHPLSLKRLSIDKANEEIEKGHAAVTLAAGEPIAPFFRFPGLSDSAAMLRHLQGRGIASSSVDSVSDDSYISDPDKLLEHALKEVDDHRGGIVLFHDIKPATARMLPRFLSELQARGYKIVHMRPKGQVAPLATYLEKLSPLLAKSQKSASATPALVPFYAMARPPASMDDEPAESTPPVAAAPVAAVPELAPPPVALGFAAPEPMPVTAIAPLQRARPDPKPIPKPAAVSSASDKPSSASVRGLVPPPAPL